MNNSAELNKVITAAIQRSPCAVGIEAEIVCSFLLYALIKNSSRKNVCSFRGLYWSAEAEIKISLYIVPVKYVAV